MDKKILTKFSKSGWYTTKLPTYLVFCALIILVFLSFYNVFYKNNISQILTIYLAITAIIFSLAAISFSYSNTLDSLEDKIKIRSGGEFFFHSGLDLITAILISWLGAAILNELNELFDPLSKIIQVILIVIFSLGQSFLLQAALGFNRGLSLIQAFLFEKVKDDINLLTYKL